MSISLDTNQEGTGLYLLGIHTKHTVTATDAHMHTNAAAHFGINKDVYAHPRRQSDKLM